MTWDQEHRHKRADEQVKGRMAMALEAAQKGEREPHTATIIARAMEAARHCSAAVDWCNDYQTHEARERARSLIATTSEQCREKLEAELQRALARTCGVCHRPLMPDHSVCFSDDCTRLRAEQAAAAAEPQTKSKKRKKASR